MVSTVSANGTGYVSAADNNSDASGIGAKKPDSNQPSVSSVPAQDTVKLSTSAQILSMKQGGSTVSQIAANLGVPETEVDQELGITSSSSSTSSEASILAALSAKH